MCGILGGFLKKDFDLNKTKLLKALNKLDRRGPDKTKLDFSQIKNGNFILGHTRLSIIDLTNKANQPMYSKDGRYGVIFNGEIVNYIELRNQLKNKGRKFYTHSDTEVLISAWQEWKENCIEKLDGMFAFGVFDFTECSLTIVRDGFGIKPVFYQNFDDNFLFASEIVALNEIKLVSNELNWKRAYDYLEYGKYDFDGQTFYKHIYSIKPGYFLKINFQKQNTLVLKKWWSPKIHVDRKISYADSVYLIRENFLKSIRRNLRSDVPIGAALSGGIDSSSIVCSIKSLEPDAEINTFSYIDKNPNTSEEKWVDKINKFTNSIENKIHLNDKDLINDFDDLVLTQGEPFGGPSIYAQYRVFKHINERNIKVTLDGQGADEMLGGYNGYPGYRIHSLIDKKKYYDAFIFLNAWSNYTNLPKLEALKRLINSMTSGELNFFLRKFNNIFRSTKYINKSIIEENGVDLLFTGSKKTIDEKGRRMISFMRESLTKIGLQSLLRHGDRNSMRFSIESRVPFLTKDLTAIVFSLPESYIVSNHGQPKSIFRDAMKDIVPQEVLLRRDKVGFEVTGNDILFAMKDTIYDWFDSGIDIPFLKIDLVKKEFERFYLGEKNYSHHLWRLMNFYRWHMFNF